MSCFSITIPCESELFERLLENDELEGISLVAEEGQCRIYSEDRSQLEALLRESGCEDSYQIAAVEEREWRDRWAEQLPEVIIPGLPFPIVSAFENNRDERALVLDPGRSFGIGHHETTQIVLQLMAAEAQKEPELFRGATVIDVGCGSGILGIVASRLGAERVIFVDNDPEALRVTEENARRNGVAAFSLKSAFTSEEAVRCRIVLINMLLRDSTLLAPLLCRPELCIFGSGFLTEQTDEFLHVFSLREQRRLSLGDWSGVAGVI